VTSTAESGAGRPDPGSDGSCAVTVVCGQRRMDVALPSMLPWADLEPSLLRLLFADQPPDGAGRWLLTPVGRAPLDPSATLSGAGIVTADVLVLGQSTGNASALTGVAPTVRDRLEDLVDGRDQFWERRQSHRLALWAAAVLGAALLIPVAAMGLPVVGQPTAPAAQGLPAGFGLAAVAATVALLLGLTAALAARGAEMHCAAACLVVACGWAGVAGWVAFCGWTASSTGAGAVAELPTLVAVGTVSALLIAGSGAAVHPAALVHAAALATFGGIASAAALAVRAGAPTAETCCLGALSAVLMIGVGPRLALAMGGVSGIEPDRNPAELDARMIRADRVLTGVVVGLSLAAVVGGLPAALSADGWHRLFAIGLGVALLLRSRVFSQIRHVLPLRVGGLLVLAELWLGLTVGDPALLVPLTLGPVALLSLTAVLTAGTGRSAVTRARVARALDLAEVVLVAVLVVLAAGLLGWFGWLAAVIG
jgi:type VII secretion integral membrane protein EccD